MALSTDAYRALEDIVGPKYISQDPAVMDSYAYQWLAETVRPGRSKFMPRPEAALLPGSTIPAYSTEARHLLDIYLDFARFPLLARVEPRKEGVLLEWVDLRFSVPGRAFPFVLQLYLDADGGLLQGEVGRCLDNQDAPRGRS